MRKVYNFSAGPAMLPEEVLLEAQKELLDWHGSGMSIMEIGHRGPHYYQAVAEQSEADLRELLSIPKNYHVLFLAGGATAQFAMVPLNLFSPNKKANSIDTGIWSKKAIAEAKRYGEVHLSGQSFIQNDLIHIPTEDRLTMTEDAAYLHYTPNETIEGVEFHWVPKTTVPLVADMSSNILSRPITVSDFGIIYAGAQKNMGQAGITVVIIREDLIKEPQPRTPTLYSYKIEVENKSMYNTPPTFAWYIAGLTFAWMKKQGGIQVFAEKNRKKAHKLYQFIDSHRPFYMNNVAPSCRSMMNVPFNIAQHNLTDTFLQDAFKEGLTNLGGHRLAGGVRASIYNAMPEAGVDKLIDFMGYFVKKYG